MCLVKWLFVILLGITTGLICVIFQFSFWLAIVMIIVVGMLSIIRIVYIMYGTRNMELVHSYLKRYKNKPLFAYMLTLEEGNKELEIQAMERMIAHYRQPLVKYTYEMNRAIYVEDFDQAAYFAEKLGKHPNGNYGKALVAAANGNLEEARNILLKYEWMHFALEAMIAYYAKDRATFIQQAELAVNATRGLQRFAMVYSLKNRENEL